MSSERLAVIGDPIGQSLSPAMQNAALEAAGSPAIYEARQVRAETLLQEVDILRSDFRGFNVTVPHKLAIIHLLDELDDLSRRVSAVNTVVNETGRLIGYNTDVAGFRLALFNADVDPRGRSAVIFGSGGAARAALIALADAGATVTVVSRDPARGSKAARLVPGTKGLTYSDPDLSRVLDGSDIIVNATTLGMKSSDDSSPLASAAWLRRDAILFDLVYGRATRFLAQGRDAGCRVMDGLEMLVRQGAEAFRLWMGFGPDLEVMRNACRAELEQRKVPAMAEKQ